MSINVLIILYWQPLIRESLNSIFGRVTEDMSSMQRPRMLPGALQPQMLHQLPEMVSSLQKDVYFFKPEETVTMQEFQVTIINSF